MNERRVSTYHEILELTNICLILRAMKRQQIYIFLVIYACTDNQRDQEQKTKDEKHEAYQNRGCTRVLYRGSAFPVPHIA
jgi:hypothetical protein